MISRRSKALRPEVFRGFSRVELRCGPKVLLATLLITDDDTLVGPDDVGLAEPAFRRFSEPAGSFVTVTPAASPRSLDAVRAKIQGHTLSATEISAIVDDLTHYRYSDMEIAAFLISSASFMTSDELLALTHAMAQAGTQLTWDKPIVVDKHCIGGIPGNRTSMIVVPIVAAHGLHNPQDLITRNHVACGHSGHDGDVGASGPGSGTDEGGCQGMSWMSGVGRPCESVAGR